MHPPCPRPCTGPLGALFANAAAGRIDRYSLRTEIRSIKFFYLLYAFEDQLEVRCACCSFKDFRVRIFCGDDRSDSLVGLFNGSAAHNDCVNA